MSALNDPNAHANDQAWLDASIAEVKRLAAENERLTLILNQVERTALAAGNLRGELVYLASAYTQAFESICMMAHQREPARQAVAAPVGRLAPPDGEQEELLQIIETQEPYPDNSDDYLAIETNLRRYEQERRKKLEDKLERIQFWAMNAWRGGVVCSGPLCRSRRETLGAISNVAKPDGTTDGIPF